MSLFESFYATLISGSDLWSFQFSPYHTFLPPSWFSLVTLLDLVQTQSHYLISNLIILRSLCPCDWCRSWWKFLSWLSFNSSNGLYKTAALVFQVITKQLKLRYLLRRQSRYQRYKLSAPARSRRLCENPKPGTHSYSSKHAAANGIHFTRDEGQDVYFSFFCRHFNYN